MNVDQLHYVSWRQGRPYILDEFVNKERKVWNNSEGILGMPARKCYIEQFILPPPNKKLMVMT